MTTHEILLHLLPLLYLFQHCLAVIDNRKPDANYVIPIDRNQKAEVYCVSAFDKTIFQEVREDKLIKLTCQKCSLDHVKNRCCRVVKWSDIETRNTTLTLRCTSNGLETGDGPSNVPLIHISIVKKESALGDRVSDDSGRYKAYSSIPYFCHSESNITRLTAGSHIGLGWVSKAADDADAPTAASSDSSYTEEAKQYDQVISDNNQNKEEQYSQLYNDEKFAKLWISEDMKVELMEHNRNFTCNQTEYWLERGSRCLTPSRRALFIMTNCNLVEKIFIVIGVIVLLVISYILFNLTVWLWNYLVHKSKRQDDDLAVLM